MTRTDLSSVIENSWCIGCGACAVADETVELALHPTKLIFEPTSPGGPVAASVCPAVQVDFAGLQAEIFPGAVPGEYGVIDSVLLAQSTDEGRNLRASSGGLIKEMLHRLLEDPEVDGIIALDEVAGLDFRPRLLTDPDDIDRMPGSIYHNLAQPEALEILASTPGKYVLVAIPCQLEGIYNYIHNVRPELADRIHMTIGLLCGWQYSHHSIRAICEYKGIDPDDIVEISYRGGGPVGKLRIVTSDGKETTTSRRVDIGYQVAFDRHFNTPRCHLCINHSNFLADIVVGDAWLPSTLTTKTGISLVICRTAASRALVDELEARQRVICTEVTTEEIRESQTDRVVFGDFAYAYAEYLTEQQVEIPVMIGPNRERAKLRPRKEVEHFHRELTRKLELQRAARYRFLWVRKLTVEFRRFAERYLKWFFVRVLKIKSLTGQRKELPKDKLSIFR
jgi:coenzyme F420 hydrogenase subunit beta